MVDLGTDIKNDWSFTDGDLNIISDEYNLGQAIVNRLRTDKGFYDTFYQNYGSELYEHIGDINNERITDYIKIAVESCLLQDPRIHQVNVEVEKTDSSTIHITVNVLLIDDTTIISYNLVIGKDNKINLLNSTDTNYIEGVE